MSKLKVFLGGTTGSNWRDKLIPLLSKSVKVTEIFDPKADTVEIEAFNPVVGKWDEKAYQKELERRKTDDVILYVITPRFRGFYSFAEVVDDSNKRPEKTILCILKEDEGKVFTGRQMRSINAIKRMVTDNGAVVAEWEELPKLLNNLARIKI